MQIEIKRFDQFTINSLYETLQLRAEVFVVEQDCPYQDVDGKDQKALHVLGYKDQILVAYTRVFKPGDYFENASIGRVIVKESYRKYGYGQNIMRASIAYIETHFKTETIALSAQCYLKKFYNDLGFFETGSEYLEDNIPHIKMIKTKKVTSTGDL